MALVPDNLLCEYKDLSIRYDNYEFHEHPTYIICRIKSPTEEWFGPEVDVIEHEVEGGYLDLWFTEGLRGYYQEPLDLLKDYQEKLELLQGEKNYQLFKDPNHRASVKSAHVLLSDTTSRDLCLAIDALEEYERAIDALGKKENELLQKVKETEIEREYFKGLTEHDDWNEYRDEYGY